MTTVRVRIDPGDASSHKHIRIELARVDATTEQEIQDQIDEDEKQAMMDAAVYLIGLRKRLGLNQAEFAEIINVSLKTIRDWEHGKRSPNGSTRALLKILDREPKVALSVLRRPPW